MSRVKVENGIATITSKTSNPRRQQLKRNPNFNRRAAGACDLGGNPIRGDQKRPSKKKVAGLNKKKAQGRHTGGYMREKGVVAGLHGASSASTRRYQDKKAAEKEAARQQERLGGRAKSKPKARRQVSGGRLGGGSSSGGSTGGSNAASAREARLAALAARGL